MWLGTQSLAKFKNKLKL